MDSSENKTIYWVVGIIIAIILIWYGWNWYHTRISSFTPQSGTYSCPDDKPIKGNSQSGIYHIPGGQYYNKTMPERCFGTEEDAINAGFRQSSR